MVNLQQPSVSMQPKILSESSKNKGGRPKIEDRDEAKKRINESKKNYQIKSMKVCDICRPIYGDKLQSNMSMHVKSNIHRRMVENNFH